MEISNTLLEKYLEGTLSEREERTVEEWFLTLRAARGEAAIEQEWNNDKDTKRNKHGDISNRALLKKTLLFILEHDRGSEEPVRDAIRSKIKTLSLVDEPGMSVPVPGPEENKQRGKAISWPSVTKWAAAIFLLFIAGYYGYYLVDRNEEQTGIVNTELKIKATVPGQKSTIYLADGSKVILNSMSELAYPGTFGPDTRKITLKGEAFFEVAKDPARPFIVTTGNISTTALGTSFNIRAYANDKDVQVALVEGKVSVKAADPSIADALREKVILLPGEAAYYTGGSGILEKGNFDARKTLSWKDRILYFDQTELGEAFNTLERWYGIDFVVTGNPEKPLYLNGEFHDETLQNVLEVLSYSNHFSYEIQQQKVLINLSDNP